MFIQISYGFIAFIHIIVVIIALVLRITMLWKRKQRPTAIVYFLLLVVFSELLSC
jgi:hypothetical protein